MTNTNIINYITNNAVLTGTTTAVSVTVSGTLEAGTIDGGTY